MLIERANPWVCLGVAFAWLALSLLSPPNPEAVPSLSLIVASNFAMHAMLVATVLLAAATVALQGRSRSPLHVLRCDLIRRATGARRAVAAGLAAGAAVAALSLAVSLLVGLVADAAGRDIELQPIVGIFMRSSVAGKAVLFASLALASPFVEELFFRYALESSLRGALSSALKPVLYGALLFAAMHGNLAAFPSLAIVSAGCSIAYRRTGSFLTPVVAHMFFNLASLSLILAGFAT